MFEQTASNIWGNVHMPPQREHSRIGMSPIRIAISWILHRGQLPSVPSASGSAISARAPQWPQNLLPTNMVFRQDEQPTVFRRERQNSHRGRSAAAAAPQFGQLSDSGCITLKFKLRGVSLRLSAFHFREPEYPSISQIVLLPER